MGFLAVPASALSDALVAISLPQGVVRDVAEDLHLTIAFFGQGASLEDERAALDALALPPLPSAIVLTRGLALGHRGCALALVGGLDDDGARALRRVRDDALALVGRPAESRPFLPHVTIARVPKDASPDFRAACARAIADVTCALAVQVDTLALFTWRAAPRAGAARYVIDRARALR